MQAQDFEDLFTDQEIMLVDEDYLRYGYYTICISVVVNKKL